MYLWDTNILRHFASGHSTLRDHLQRVAWAEIALPSVVVAEVVQGRADYALKATPQQAPLAHRLLLETLQLLHTFAWLAFDQDSAAELLRLQRSVQTRKRYADAQIAAMALAGRHIVVTRNQAHFVDLLPPAQLANWIDEPPR